MELLDAVVIGAGQAGLSAAYHLRRRGVRDVVVLDAEDGPGGAWRHRWDSLTMATVNGIRELPDTPAPEVGGDVPANIAVLNATGIWTRPFVPVVPGAAQFRGRQLHTAEYVAADEFAERRVAERGILDRRPMFTRIVPDGVIEADGMRTRLDAILWATGFRHELRHLRPLRLTGPLGGIVMDGTAAAADPRIHLVGHGPGASTIGANRAGRAAVNRLVRDLEAGLGAALDRELARA